MLGPEGRLVGGDAGFGAMKLSPSRMGERRVDAVAHQSVDELEALGRAPEKCIAQQNFGVVARVFD
jgi:hypothetical protein